MHAPHSYRSALAACPCRLPLPPALAALPLPVSLAAYPLTLTTLTSAHQPHAILAQHKHQRHQQQKLKQQNKNKNMLFIIIINMNIFNIVIPFIKTSSCRQVRDGCDWFVTSFAELMQPLL